MATLDLAEQQVLVDFFGDLHGFNCFLSVAWRVGGCGELQILRCKLETSWFAEWFLYIEMGLFLRRWWMCFTPKIPSTERLSETVVRGRGLWLRSWGSNLVVLWLTRRQDKDCGEFRTLRCCVSETVCPLARSL